MLDPRVPRAGRVQRGPARRRVLRRPGPGADRGHPRGRCRRRPGRSRVAKQARAAEAAGCDLVVAQGVRGGRASARRGARGCCRCSTRCSTRSSCRSSPPAGSGGPARRRGGAGRGRVGRARRHALHRRGGERRAPGYKDAARARRPLPTDAVLTARVQRGRDPVETTQRVLASCSGRRRRRCPKRRAGEGPPRRDAPHAGASFRLDPPTAGSSGALEAMSLYAGQSVGGVTASSRRPPRSSPSSAGLTGVLAALQG